MKFIYRTFLCIVLANAMLFSAAAQSLVAGEYFFNADPGVGLGNPITIAPGNFIENNFSIPTAGLQVGFHNLFIRFKDNAGKWGLTEDRSFLVEKINAVPFASIIKAEYFFDTDPGVGKGSEFVVPIGDSVDTNLPISTNGLAAGVHQLFIRTLDNRGIWSIAEQRTFLVETIPVISRKKIKAGEYFIDTDPGIGKGQTITVSIADSLQLTVPVISDTLSKGVHQLFIRYQQDDNTWGIAESRNFLVDGGNENVADSIVAGEYFTTPDPGAGNGIAFNVSKGMSIDTIFNYIANNLPFGNYMLGIRLKNAKGQWGFSESRAFRTCETYGPLAKFEVVKDGNKVSLLNRSEYATSYKWQVNNSTDSISSGNVYKELPSGNYKAFLAATNGCGRDTMSKFFAIEGIKGIYPSKGGNIGKATVKIEGFGFVPGTTFILTKDGTSIPADAAVVANGNVILTGLYLIGVPSGYYRLEVQVPGKPMLVKDSAFRVEPGVQPLITIASQLPPNIRTNVPTLLKVYATNKGNVDAYGVPIIVTGLPISSVTRLVNDTATRLPGLEYDNGPRSNLNRFELIDSIAGTKMISLVVPRIGPSETVEILIELTGKSSGVTFNYFVKSLEPLYLNESVVGGSGKNANGQIQQTGDCGGGGGGPGGGMGGPGGCANCMADKMSDALQLVAESLLDLLPIGSIHECFLGTADIISGQYKLQTEEEDCPNNENALKPLNTVMAYNDLALAIAKTGADCAAAVLKTNPAVLAANTAYQAIKAIGNASKVYNAFKTGFELGDCAAKDPPCNQPPCKDCGGGGGSRFLTSFDPNEKKGPGYADSSYIRTTSDLTYTVFYENAPKATLPAQTVIVYDTLDKAKFDPATLVFTLASVGTKSVSLASNGFNAIGSIDLRPAVPHIARINAMVDTATGIIQWQVQTIDTLTGQETTDPLAGYLPPNNNTHWGEGSFSYTIKLRSSVQQGDTIRNKASIVFDANEAIITNNWVNLFDTGLPSSNMNALAPITNKDSVIVSWSGADAVSGIDFYNIWVSVNDGPFVIWLSGTTALTDTFVGIYGNTYRFYSQSQDKAGNREVLKSTAEATTTLYLAPTVFTFNGNGSYKDPANWQGGFVPPTVLPSSSEIIINPSDGNGEAECIMDKVQEIRPGGKFSVTPGKKLRLLANMEIRKL